MKLIQKMLCILIVIATVLCGCGQIKEVRKDSAPKQEEIKELCVLYTPENEILIKNFESLYPEYKLEKVLLANDIGSAMESGIIPDLILAEGSTPIMEWYERGIIQTIGPYYDEDGDINEEDYFPGSLTVGREKDLLLALPVSAQIPYMTAQKSVVERTAFGRLDEEYTLEQFMYAMEQEFSEINAGSMVVSGAPFCYQFIELLIATGILVVEEEHVEMDLELFEQLYDICVKNCKNYEEEAIVSTLGYRDATIDPRDGDHILAYWLKYPLQVGVLYAQSVNRQFVDEDIDVFCWPMAGEEGRYGAKIAMVGMIGAEAKHPEAAYDVLRKMMDMPLNEWMQPQRALGIQSNMYMPVHVENAKNLCNTVESSGLTEFSVASLEKKYEIVEKQKWNGAIKEKVCNILDGIQYVYRVDQSINTDLYTDVVYEYIGKMNENGATACYEEVLKYFQAKMNGAEEETEGKYFSFSPIEYTNQLEEILIELDQTKYETDYVIESSYRCTIKDTTQSEIIADLYGMESHFFNEGYFFTANPDDKKITQVITYLNDRKYENLFPLMSAIIMTCDPSLDEKGALEVIDMIPIYDTSNLAGDSEQIASSYEHNGIEYKMEKWNFSDYMLSISIAEE